MIVVDSFAIANYFWIISEPKDLVADCGVMAYLSILEAL